MDANASTFIAVFPEFTGTDLSAVTFWIEQASGALALNRLGGRADLATYLFVAHNLVLGRQDLQDVEDGDLPGDTLGPVASKSAGGLSVTYDSASIAMDGAGPYNATSYGQRLWVELRNASLGGMFSRYVGRRCSPYSYSRLPWA